MSLLLTDKEALILDLLGNREMYGLELVNASDGKLSRGTIYPTLYRMQQKELVTSRQEDRAPEAVGIPRRLYKATPQGKRELAARESQAPDVRLGFQPA